MLIVIIIIYGINPKPITPEVAFLTERQDLKFENIVEIVGNQNSALICYIKKNEFGEYILYKEDQVWHIEQHQIFDFEEIIKELDKPWIQIYPYKNGSKIYQGKYGIVNEPKLIDGVEKRFSSFEYNGKEYYWWYSH